MEKVSKLVKLFETTTLTEMAYTTDDFSLTLKKSNTSSIIDVPKIDKVLEKETIVFEKENKSDNSKIMTSESVGIFYMAPSPSEKNFINIGDMIEIGQVIGILEAMKVMTEIKSTVSGQVKTIFVNNGDMVEYGTKLIEVSDV